MINLDVYIFYPQSVDCNSQTANYLATRIFSIVAAEYGVGSEAWNNINIFCTTKADSPEIAVPLGVGSTPAIVFFDKDKSLALRKLQGSIATSNQNIKTTLQFLFSLTTDSGGNGYVTPDGGGFNPLVSDGNGGFGLPLLDLRGKFPNFPISFKWIFAAATAYSGYKYQKKKSKLLWGTIGAYAAINLIGGKK